MKVAQIIKRKKPTVSIIITRRQNLSEEEIPFLYSVEKGGNQDITRYQKCANPVYKTLYGQAVKLKQILSTH
jgi:hypothetical protein